MPFEQAKYTAHTIKQFVKYLYDQLFDMSTERVQGLSTDDGVGVVKRCGSSARSASNELK